MPIKAQAVAYQSVAYQSVAYQITDSCLSKHKQFFYPVEDSVTDRCRLENK